MGVLLTSGFGGLGDLVVVSWFEAFRLIVWWDFGGVVFRVCGLLVVDFRMWVSWVFWFPGYFSSAGFGVLQFLEFAALVCDLVALTFLVWISDLG